jgi:hypothetical protein
MVVGMAVKLGRLVAASLLVDIGLRDREELPEQFFLFRDGGA